MRIIFVIQKEQGDQLYEISREKKSHDRPIIIF